MLKVILKLLLPLGVLLLFLPLLLRAELRPVSMQYRALPMVGPAGLCLGVAGSPAECQPAPASRR
ncbi:hypothetical protein [Hymenobacter pini]|uniref:hypothetical protein n=1 Tax=Hymenobacter pini TaxID=2880879 RepID=UPI001CF4C7AC|nr:hypothetical protein [Hymenobacter pini]MCA8833172.1 hypothetical protein [Hymenobacter pini]